MYSTTGLEANDLVNFYNSNILDEMMLNKNSTSAGKFIGAKGTNVKPQHAMNAHLRKSAQSCTLMSRRLRPASASSAGRTSELKPSGTHLPDPLFYHWR